VRLVGRDPQTSADIYVAHSLDPLAKQLRFFVEVKREKNTVGIEIIDKVLGALLLERPEIGWHAAIIVSLGGFKHFRKYSKHKLSLLGLELKNRDDLLHWLEGYRPKKNGLWLPYPLRTVPRIHEVGS
jgi:hypothetical protein